MNRLRQIVRASGHVALLLAVGPAVGAQGESVADAAIETLQPGWKVLHCGVSRGVLYVTYGDLGKAAIAPAFATPAIRRACAEAGYPVTASAPARTPVVPVEPRVDRPAAVPKPPPVKTRVEPTFVVRSTGSALEISGRNDGDAAYRCVINFSWTFDDDPIGPRSVTTQATLPGRQVNRVVFVSGPYRNARFVGLPTWHCIATD